MAAMSTIHDDELNIYDLESTHQVYLFTVQPADVLNALTDKNGQDENDESVRDGADLDAAVQLGPVDFMEDEERERVRTKAMVFLQKQLKQCTCTPRCSFPGMKAQACVSAEMPERERSNCIRRVLFNLLSLADQQSEIRSGLSGERKRVRTEEDARYNANNVYALLGQKVCRPVFRALCRLTCGIFQLSWSRSQKSL